jgi:basic amino acid/polyamine antiporter, APA family
VIFYAYIGFDAVTTAAQEAKTPARNVPVGIVGSLLICMVLYVLVSFVLTGVVSYKELNVPAPVAFAVDRASPAVAWARIFIELGVIAGLSSVILVALMAQPRIFYRMALDGLLPGVFARVHPRFRTPFVTTLATGAAAAVIAGLVDQLWGLCPCRFLFMPEARTCSPASRSWGKSSRPIVPVAPVTRIIESFLLRAEPNR